MLLTNLAANNGNYTLFGVEFEDNLIFRNFTCSW